MLLLLMILLLPGSGCRNQIDSLRLLSVKAFNFRVLDIALLSYRRHRELFWRLLLLLHTVVIAAAELMVVVLLQIFGMIVVLTEGHLRATTTWWYLLHRSHGIEMALLR